MLLKDVMVSLPISTCVQIFAHQTILLLLIKMLLRLIPNLALELAIAHNLNLAVDYPLYMISSQLKLYPARGMPVSLRRRIK